LVGEISSNGEARLPVSALNGLRRETLDGLLRARSNPRPIPYHKPETKDLPRRMSPSPPQLRVRAQRAKQLEALDLSLFSHVMLPACEIAAHAFPIDAQLVGELPALQYQKYDAAVLHALRQAGVSALLCEHLGAIETAREHGFAAIGGHGLNITNSLALREYASMGVQDVTLSFELRAQAIAALYGDSTRGIIGYGYLPLMYMRACPIGARIGCGDCMGHGQIQDRRHTAFPILCHHKRYASLLNSVPLYMADKPPEGIDFITLYFTVETPEQCRTVVERFLRKEPCPTPFTRGLY
ncbi:MAG: U32 family peptidase, partial [Clostridia bacterium]|nr:U32 family peptidase [Clostridia bacterium]